MLAISALGSPSFSSRSIRHNYPNLNRWVSIIASLLPRFSLLTLDTLSQLRNLYWNNPSFKDTTNFEHIKVRRELALSP